MRDEVVSFSGLKMVFSKLSLAKYHCLHNKPLATNGPPDKKVTQTKLKTYVYLLTPFDPLGFLQVNPS